MPGSIILRGWSLILVTALLSSGCNNDSSLTDAEGQYDSLGTAEKQRRYVSFKDLSPERSTMAIDNLDSLKSTPLTVYEYLNRKDSIESAINGILNDTVPSTTEEAELSSLKLRLQVLTDHAYVKAASVCDRPDFFDLESFPGVAGIPANQAVSLGRAVAALKWKGNVSSKFSGTGDDPGDVDGKFVGTGFMISPEYFLTAWHCFKPSSMLPKRRGVVISDTQMLEHMEIVFNYQRLPNSAQLRETVTFEIAELISSGNPGHDYMLLRIKPKQGVMAGARFGFLTMAPADHPVRDNDPIYIIQHADGTPKQIAVGNVAAVDFGNIYYGNLDTYSGASGSPVINASGLVVAVHGQGDCFTGSIGGANYGLSSKSIRAVCPRIP